MVSQIYPSELQRNNASYTKASCLNFYLFISNDIVSNKIYNKRDCFDLKIIIFRILDGDVTRSHIIWR